MKHALKRALFSVMNPHCRYISYIRNMITNLNRSLLAFTSRSFQHLYFIKILLGSFTKSKYSYNMLYMDLWFASIFFNLSRRLLEWLHVVAHCWVSLSVSVHYEPLKQYYLNIPSSLSRGEILGLIIILFRCRIYRLQNMIFINSCSIAQKCGQG